MPVIGVLVLGSPPPKAFLKGLRGALSNAGYIDGRSIRLEIRSAEEGPTFLPRRPPNWFGSTSQSLLLIKHQPPRRRSRQRVRFPL
jgi:hypothetical protein